MGFGRRIFFQGSYVDLWHIIIAKFTSIYEKHIHFNQSYNNAKECYNHDSIHFEYETQGNSNHEFVLLWPKN